MASQSIHIDPHEQNTDTGTNSSSFQLDNDASGVKLKNNSGTFEARNSADDDYANSKAKDLICTGELSDGTNKTDIANLLIGSINFIIDGGGSTITTGIKGDVIIPFDCTITEVTLLADQSGSIQIDIWKDSYSNFPPTDADSITASAVPNISSATKSQDATLTGWTKTIAAGSVLRFNVDSVTTIQKCTLSLKVSRT